MAREKGRREDILKAATDVFASNGFYGANISDIAEKAGIGKGTIYEYFKSKNSLFIEVIKYNANLYTQNIEQRINTEGSFREKLTSFLRCHVEFLTGNFQTARMFLKNPVEFSLTKEEKVELFNTLFAARDRIVSLIESILCQGLEEGLVLRVDTRFAADMFLEMASRCCLRVFIQNLAERQIENEQQMLLDLFMNGVASKCYNNGK
jgi:AcrR family transcriptional regulator